MKRNQYYAVCSLFLSFIVIMGSSATNHAYAQAAITHPAKLKANYRVESLVPIDVLNKIADAHAYEVWGGEVLRGEPIPAVDSNGNIFCYIFTYSRGSKQFPQVSQIFTAVRRTQARFLVSGNQATISNYFRMPPRFYADLKRLIGDFGTIYVSATRNNFPVLMVSNSLHPYFINGEVASKSAQRHLESEEATLEKIYFLGPHEEYFEFESGNKKLLLNTRTLKIAATEKTLILRPIEEIDPNIINRRIKSWEKSLESAPLGISADDVAATHTVKVIPYWRLIPVVNWTWWCNPTAATMVAGFWDNYQKGVGTVVGYGRIIDYWLENTWGNNIPNFINEIIDPATGTWSSEGFLGTLNNTNKYNFTWVSEKGTASNDWGWKALKNEIDTGKPVMWSVKPVNPHSMTAFGYRISGEEKFIIVYNTWGTTAEQQRAEYNYDQWSGSPVSETGIACLTPAGGTGCNHANLISPVGDEVILQAYTIIWYVWGNIIKETDVSFSSDGGNSWSVIQNGVQTNPGFNSFVWTPSALTSKGRIRIRCLDVSGKYISGDGSKNNFYIQSKPDILPITTYDIEGPASYCMRDDQGNLVVMIHNKGTVDAPKSLAEVQFSPGGSFKIYTPAIPAGKTVEVLFDMPANCPNPDCEFRIIVDSENNVDEANENNNSVMGLCIG